MNDIFKGFKALMDEGRRRPGGVWEWSDNRCRRE
jgi:hypothetical protein